MRKLGKDDEKALESLIQRYADNKKSLESYKKICDDDKEQIKELMASEGIRVKRAGDLVAKRVVSVRETLNEEKLIPIIKRNLTPDRWKGIIRTKEFVDMAALERFLYSADMPDSFFADLETCKTTSEVVSLKISKQVDTEE